MARKRILPIPLILLIPIVLLAVVIIAGIYRFSLSDEEIMAESPEDRLCRRFRDDQNADQPQNGKRSAQGQGRQRHSAFDHQPLYLRLQWRGRGGCCDGTRDLDQPLFRV